MTCAAAQGKLYAEKLHDRRRPPDDPDALPLDKMEDIINRGGGKLAIQLYNSTPEGDLAGTDVVLSTDGVERRFAAGEILLLDPGESVTLTTGVYHRFWGEQGQVLIGEVSLVNDDDRDNRFHEPTGRFPEVDEDEEPLYLLVKDYGRYWGGGRGGGGVRREASYVIRHSSPEGVIRHWAGEFVTLRGHYVCGTDCRGPVTRPLASTPTTNNSILSLTKDAPSQRRHH